MNANKMYNHFADHEDCIRSTEYIFDGIIIECTFDYALDVFISKFNLNSCKECKYQETFRNGNSSFFIHCNVDFEKNFISFTPVTV